MPRGAPTKAIPVRFTDADLAVVDAARGEVSRSEWLRQTALDAARGGRPPPALRAQTGSLVRSEVEPRFKTGKK